MAKIKKVKTGKKGLKTKKDPLNVFDPGAKKSSDVSRDELIKKDKLKFAKRYEAMNLFDESIKYYKQLGMEDEVERVTAKKTELYLSKAKEFESEGRFSEAAELYDRLDMTERAAKLLKKAGVKPEEPLDLEERAFGTATEASPVKNPQASRGIRWEMPNTEMDDVSGEPAGLEVDQVTRSMEEAQVERKSTDIEKPLSEIASSEISWDEEEDSERSQPDLSTADKSGAGKDTSKTFSICPFCGEELNLPKQPKFCPYCKEAFQ
jgi:tetratricopeptide (TPR) repeat protein